ncbi:MAG: glycine--tRNA ligase [Phycisphaeraceae bacterium]
MSESPAASPKSKSMDDIVALCRRRGFIWQSSEIYGGINGFWDYGPLGAELKRNLKDAWWHDIVKCPPAGPHGDIIDMVGVDCTIIMNPKVWVASGHVGGFNDPMIDDKETKQRFRADHFYGLFITMKLKAEPVALANLVAKGNSGFLTDEWKLIKTYVGTFSEVCQANHFFNPGTKVGALKVQLGTTTYSAYDGYPGENPISESVRMHLVDKAGNELLGYLLPISIAYATENAAAIPSPFNDKAGSLTEPRQFNLMFESYIGAVRDDENRAYLRPETAQGIFCNFKNVVDTSRVKVPFGIAQVGKAFRNEVTPRNFTFRSREFEQMEIEFFIRPETANEWYRYWRDARFAWWKSIGLAGDNLQLREHDKDELAHYAKDGAGTCDIEYRFPFTAPGFGELEGVAHRTDFDLRQHARHSGLGDKLKYFDQELQVQMQAQGASKEEIAERSKYFPHVIEPSAGADRGTLALLCEAYTADPGRPSGVFMKFDPRMAPIKAGVFPLVNKEGMPEVAHKLYLELRQKWNIEYDPKSSIGKRYARMDEAGTPYCFTIDGDTLTAGTVTVRDRDTLKQGERIALDKVGAFLAEKVG